MTTRLYNYIMDYKLTPFDLRIGYATIPCNTAFEVETTLDKKWFDATQAHFTYNKACRLTSASIAKSNKFLIDTYGIDTIDNNSDIFYWVEVKNSDGKIEDHLMITMNMFERVLDRFDKFDAIKHL